MVGYPVAMTEETIQASQFKARCLALLDEVEGRHRTYILTKHGRPVARPAPLDAPAPATGMISPITCWEVAMLVEKGRVALDRPLARWVDDLVASEVDVAELTPAIAAAAGVLDDFHGDPADRLIYATAAERGLPLI